MNVTNSSNRNNSNINALRNRRDVTEAHNTEALHHSLFLFYDGEEEKEKEQ